MEIPGVRSRTPFCRLQDPNSNASAAPHSAFASKTYHSACSFLTTSQKAKKKIARVSLRPLGPTKTGLAPCRQVLQATYFFYMPSGKSLCREPNVEQPRRIHKCGAASASTENPKSKMTTLIYDLTCSLIYSKATTC